MKANYRHILAMGVAAVAVTATAQLLGRSAAQAESEATEASLDNPVNCTEYIQNPSFAEGTTGWTNPNSVTHWNGTVFEEMECWNSSADCYQVLSGLPEGVYELRVQAFYRSGDTDAAWTNKTTAEANGEQEPLNAYYYAGGSEKAIVSYFSSPDACPNGGAYVAVANAGNDAVDKEGHRYPNGMYSAMEAFENGGYWNTGLYFLSDGTSSIQIGIRKTQANTLAYDWMVWDNFELYYVGQGDDAYAKVVENFIENVDYEYYAGNTDVTESMIARFTTAYDALVAASKSGEGIRAAVVELNAAKSAIDSYISNKQLIDDLYLGFAADNVSDALSAKVEAAYDKADAAIEKNEGVEEALAEFRTLIGYASDIDNLYSQYIDADVSVSLTEKFEQAFAAADAALVAGEGEEEAVAEVKSIAEEIKTEADAYASLFEYLEGSGSDFYGDNRYQDEADFTAWTTLYDEAQEAYENHTYTAEEALAVINQLRDNAQYIQGNATKPGDDITFMLENPTFDGDYAYAMTQITGWTLTGDDGVSFTRDYNLLESFIGSKGPSFKISQTLKGLKAGVYTIRCQAFVRPGYRGLSDYTNGSADADIQSYIFGNANKTKIKSIAADRRSEGFLVGVKNDDGSDAWYNDSKYDDGTYVPNCLQSTRMFFDDETYTDATTGNKGRYWNEVRVFVSKEANQLELGFMGTASTDYYWTAFDNFQLVYSGNDFATIKDMCAEALEEASQYEGANMNADVKSEFTELMAKVDDALTRESGDDLLDLYPQLLDVNPRVAASVAEYVKLETARLEAGDVADGYDLTTDVRAEFDEYLAGVDKKLESGAYADAEIPTAIDELNAELASLRVKGFDFSGASTAKPKDITSLLEDPDFDVADGKGWLGDQLSRSGTVSEQYNKAFHVYQILSGMPKGVYKVEVQAFYREGWPEPAYSAYRNGTANQQYNVKAYANNDTILLQPIGKGAISQTVLKNEGDEEEPYWVYNDEEISSFGDKISYTADDVTEVLYQPNSMGQAQYCFDFSENYATQEFTTEVGDNGILQIGFKHDTYTGGDWTMFNEIRLYYLGTDGYTAIEQVSTEANAGKVEIFSVNGTAQTRLQKGINIVRTTLENGNVIVRKVFVK